MRKCQILTLILFLILIPRAWPQNNLIQLKSIIQISSNVSEGQYTLEEIVSIAYEKGVSVVIPTDRYRMRWEYGLWPLRKLIKKRVEHKSISTYGIKSYLNEIAKVQSKFPNTVLIAGLEAAPYYYWRGFPFRDSFSIHDWHKHILAIGLDRPEDYKNLPVIGNPPALAKDFSTIKLWPFLLFLIGILCLSKRKYNYQDQKGVKLGQYSPEFRRTGYFLIFISLLFIINNWPFLNYRFDQYGFKSKLEPFQDFFDYVKEKEGLSFWAHPEAEYFFTAHKVHSKTEKHHYDLLKTHNYNGFAIFYEGYEIIGKPGGIWDKILLDYCQGKRLAPIWAIGALAFESGDLSKSIDDLQTIILAKEKTKTGVLEAIEKGRMYVARGSKSLDFKLSEFYLCDEFNKNKAFVGSSTSFKGKSIIHIKGEFLKSEQPLEVRIIKEGKVLVNSKVQSPFVIDYIDNLSQDEKTYYRLEIISKDLHLVTNPIFLN
tara:strand:- start:498 stop:1952 length:1455 start_codon:yes stop_codon:yes gene_type:complete